MAHPDPQLKAVEQEVFDKRDVEQLYLLAKEASEKLLRADSESVAAYFGVLLEQCLSYIQTRSEANFAFDFLICLLLRLGIRNRRMQVRVQLHVFHDETDNILLDAQPSLSPQVFSSCTWATATRTCL